MNKRLAAAALSFLLALSLLPGTALAAGTPCGTNLTYTLESGTLTIHYNGGSGGDGTMDAFGSAQSVYWSSERNNISSVVIEEGVTSISDWAFYGFVKLTSITIPQSVTSVGLHAFTGAGLTEIFVRENRNYVSQDGILYYAPAPNAYYASAADTLTLAAFPRLLRIPPEKYPGKVTAIGPYAFENNDQLTDYKVPGSVTALQEGAFKDCANLAVIRLPAGLTSIARDVFSGCAKLTDVYCPEKTKAEWGNVTKLSGNDVLQTATIHCKDGDIQPSSGGTQTPGDTQTPGPLDLTNTAAGGLGRNITIEATPGHWLTVQTIKGTGGGAVAITAIQVPSSGKAVISAPINSTVEVWETADQLEFDQTSRAPNAKQVLAVGKTTL